MSTNVESRQAEVDGLVTRNRPWNQILWTAGVFLAAALFVVMFYKQTFIGLTDRHAMDVAQVARNVATGKGFTTHLIRPFNVALINDQDVRNRELNSAPVFPYAVAAVFKLRSPSDQGVAWVSILFGFLTIASTYFLGKLLFNWRVGLLAAAALGTSAPVLKAATSGTEWTMAGFFFALMLLAIVLHHRSTLGQSRLAGWVYAAACAVLLALLYMTNHILLLLVIPLAVYFAVTGERGKQHLIVFAVVALLAVAPWAYRNVTCAHGSVLGANAWDIMAHTTAFPGDVLYRSTDAANLSILRALFFPLERFSAFAAKLMTGTSDVLQGMIAVLGLAIVPFALVSMLYKFRIQSANAVRGLVYGAGVVLVISFALFSVDSRAVILLAPVIAVFGSAYFFLLLDAKKLHPVYARTVIAVVVLITCWPALSSAIWKSDFAAQSKLLASSTMLKDSFSGVMYTDVPWAIAWRTSGLGVWLPCKDEDVYQLSSKGLPLNNAVLTPECDNYSPNDTWYRLHRFQFWRDYLKDPAAPASRAQISSIAAQPEMTVEKVERGLREMKRQLPISESITGCDAQRFRGLAPDDFIIVTFPPK